VSFPVSAIEYQTWAGARMARGDIALFAPASLVHHRAGKKCSWGFLSLRVRDMADWSSVILGRRIRLPKSSKIIRPHGQDAARLLHLQAKAADLAKQNPAAIQHPEVARSMEQELLVALLNCVSAAPAPSDNGTRRRRALTMLRLEQMIDSDPDTASRELLCAGSRIASSAIDESCRCMAGVASDRYIQLRRREFSAAFSIRDNE